MTDNPTHDFLLIDCGKCGFLINRVEFCASAYIQNKESGNPDPVQSVRYSGCDVALIDLYGYLVKNFRSIEEEEPRIALIVPAKTITAIDEKRSVFKTLKDRGLSTDYIALRTGNRSSIEHIPLKSIKLYPESIRKAGKKRGILGIRFDYKSDIQYYIDLHTTASAIIGEHL